MRNSISKPLSLLILVAMVFIAFGIMSGPGRSANAQGGTPAATQAPTVTPTPFGSVKDTLTIWVNLDRAPIIEAAGKAFSAKYNIPVRVQTMDFGGLRSNFVIAGPAGNGPDILAGAHDWVGELYKNGLLDTIDLGDKAKNFDPVGLKGFTYDGKLVAVPYQVEAVTLYYNKDLVPTPPKTWDEMATMAQKLLDDKKVDVGFSSVGGGGDLYAQYCFLSSFGGGVFGRDADGNYDPKQVLLDNEGSIKAATEIDKLVKAGILKDGTGYDQAKNLFLKGRLPFWVNGPWELDNIKKSGINFGLAPIPAGDHPARPFVGVQGFMVNKLSKNALLAQAFVTEFLATDDVMESLYKAQFGVPAWLPTRAKVTNADIDAFSASIAVGDPMPAIPAMASVWNAAGNAFTLIFQQKVAPDQAMKDAAKAVRDAIAKAP